MRHLQNGAIRHSFESRMAFTVGLFPLIAICVFSGREKFLFHGFEKDLTSSYFHPFHNLRLAMAFDLMCQTGDCKVLPSMKVHQLYAMINTFGLNWKKLSAFHIY